MQLTNFYEFGNKYLVTKLSFIITYGCYKCLNPLKYLVTCLFVSSCTCTHRMGVGDETQIRLNVPISDFATCMLAGLQMFCVKCVYLPSFRTISSRSVCACPCTVKLSTVIVMIASLKLKQVGKHLPDVHVARDRDCVFIFIFIFEIKLVCGN